MAYRTSLIGYAPDSAYQWMYGGGQSLEEQKRQFNEKLALYSQFLNQQRESTGGLSKLVNDYNKQFYDAQAKNEAKYKDTLGLVDQTSGQQAADIRADYNSRRSSALQSLARSGMSGTTVGATLSQGLGREQNASLTRLADTLLNTKAGIMQGFNYQAPDSGITQAMIAALAPNKSFSF